MYLTFWKLVQLNSSPIQLSWVRSQSQEQSTHSHLPAGMGQPELGGPSSIPTLTPAISTMSPLTTQDGGISFLSHSFAFQGEVLISSPAVLFPLYSFKSTSHFFHLYLQGPNSCATVILPEFLPQWYPYLYHLPSWAIPFPEARKIV